jgi:hypothetical protein
MSYSFPSDPDCPAFLHRQNPNGLHDSICTKCFQFVAKNRKETDLALYETRHECSTPGGESFFEGVLRMLANRLNRP